MEEKETIQPIEITWEELQSRDLERYILVDTRGDEAVLWNDSRSHCNSRM